MSSPSKKNELGWLLKPIEGINFICFIRRIKYYKRSFKLDDTKLLVYIDPNQSLISKEDILVEYRPSEKMKELTLEGEKTTLNVVVDVNNLFIGYVDSFNSQKGYGIIKNKYDEFFVHASNIKKGNYLEENDLVLFETTFTKDKFQAINCELIKSSSIFTEPLKRQLLYLIDSTNYDDLLSIFEKNKNRFGRIIYTILQEAKYQENVFHLGIDQAIDIKDTTLLKCILSSKDLFTDFLTKNPYGITPDISKIKLSISTSDEFIEVMFRIFYDIPEFSSKDDFHLIENIIILVNSVYPEAKQNIIDYIVHHSKDTLILDLWLEDVIDNIPIKNIFYLFPILDFGVQKKFFKKLFFEIQKKDKQIELNDILSLSVMDFETSKLGEKLDGVSLDYSISIIINILVNLQTGNDIDKNLHNIESSIYKIVESFLNSLKEPQNIIEITGFFDECDGRCSINGIENKNEAGISTYSEIEYVRDYNDRYVKPYYCDGRKYVDSKTRESILDNKYGLEFWWCQNKPCFKPSREIHSPENFQEYTLQDFLIILDIPYNQEDYELLLGLINKTNKFFSHLQCRSCKQILRPKKQSDYGFWRISLFQCKNPICDNNKEEIYLSHCLNGKCDNIIDSRVSKRCNYNNQNPPNYVGYGLFICNKCSACCNSETLKRIHDKGNINSALLKSLEWRINNKASHFERTELFCYKCGSNMINSNKEYGRILLWLIENKDKSKTIVNSGIRPIDGKYWFRLKANKNKFNTLRKFGFDVNDDYTPGIALVSEKFKSKGKFWYCSNDKCNITYDGEKEIFSDYIPEILNIRDNKFDLPF